MTPSVSSVAESFMSSITALFPYCDIFILGWTIPYIAVKRLVANQKTSRHEGIKMNICFSLTGHSCVFRQSWVEFYWVTVSTRTWRTRSDWRHSQNRSAVRPNWAQPYKPTNTPSVLLNIAVINVSLTLCLTSELSSDLWMIISFAPRIFTAPGSMFWSDRQDV